MARLDLFWRNLGYNAWLASLVVFETSALIPAVIVGSFITGLVIWAYQYGKGKARVYPVPREGYRAPHLGQLMVKAKYAVKGTNVEQVFNKLKNLQV